jgi:hypothetical protein
MRFKGYSLNSGHDALQTRGCLFSAACFRYG